MLRLGQPWVNPPQASDSLDAIAALFRVSSGVPLREGRLRGPSRRRRSRESARERARARPSPRTSIQKNSYPLSFLRFRVLLVARATPEAPPEAGSGAEKRRFNAPHLARPRVARAAARRSNDARFDARLFFLLSRRVRDDRAESRARRRVPRCPRARPRRASRGRDAETKRRIFPAAGIKILLFDARLALHARKPSRTRRRHHDARCARRRALSRVRFDLPAIARV